LGFASSLLPRNVKSLPCSSRPSTL